MPNSPIVNIRMTDQRQAQIDALAEMTGLEGPAAVIDFALATALAHYGREAEMAERRGDRMARELDQVVAQSTTMADVREGLEALGWSEEEIETAPEDPNFPDLPEY